MLRFVAFLLSAVLLGGCAVVLDPESLLFRHRPANPDRFAAIIKRDPGVEEVRLVAADGTKLHGLLKRAPAAKPGEPYPLVIVFGGVARETSWMIDWGEKPAAWGWLMVNYRGYGLSEGQPNEHALLEDARLVYDWAAARPDVDTQRIVVLGRSLGSYVAVALAAQRPMCATILATPFDSMTALAERRYPLLPMGLIVNGRYDSVALAPRIKVPALFVLADADDVTPREHGEALAKVWGGPKEMLMLEGGHRRVEWHQEYWRRVGAFLEKSAGCSAR